MTERAAQVAALLALALVATGMMLGLDTTWGSADPPPGPRTAVLFVVRHDAGPLVAMVASGGGRSGDVVTIPPNLALTVPGRGDARVRDVATLPGRLAATAVSNLVGVWIAHHAVLDGTGLASVIDRAGGLQVFADTVDGAGVLEALAGPGRLVTWHEVVRSLVSSDVDWRREDFVDVDDAGDVERSLAAAADPRVAALPTTTAPGGLPIADQGATADLMAEVFGGEGVSPVPVVVLNGSGEPSVGTSVAERLIPAGFRVVVSENAARFGHGTTLVVASSWQDRAEAERAQAALGVGTVSVSGAPTGVGDVTIVVGRDFGE